MEPIDRECLKKNHTRIVEDLHSGVDVVIRKLWEKDIISDSLRDDIRAENTPRKKASNLLDVLPTCGPKAYDAFCCILRDDYHWLTEALIITKERLQSTKKSEISGCEYPEGINITYTYSIYRLWSLLMLDRWTMINTITLCVVRLIIYNWVMRLIIYNYKI